MRICKLCGENKAAQAIGFCASCLKSLTDKSQIYHLHEPVRRKYNLSFHPPQSKEGLPCNLCANNCSMAPGEQGYCGLRENREGKLHNHMGQAEAYAYIYLDPLPTNCCAAWFCHASQQRGYNLAVFFYGCNFDCLFCQNSSHKKGSTAPHITEEEMLTAALAKQVRCVCFFGGSPEPQFGFALKVAKKIREQSNKHICWEWNGCGNQKLVKRAASYSSASMGTVKFDLKAFSPFITYALCGVDNSRSYTNFAALAKEYPENNFLTATTLLVPYYVDKEEVGAIARFISELNQEIPYSLLVFHPDFYLEDLPVTPKEQVTECYEEAKKYLFNVNIGNKHLLGGAL
ncbi:hypothetical protein ES703_04292 [subsurface metagenome]